MCTASWLRGPDGFDLFFNRDEKRTRRPATPPEVFNAGSVRALAPRDGEAGGSWIAVNEHGLTVALLNGYRSGDAAETAPDGDWVSRGNLVTDLAGCPDVPALVREFETRDLRAFRSFHLLAIDPRTEWLADWREGVLTPRVAGSFEPPLISSSFRYDEVAASRCEQYREQVAGATEAKTLAALAYHRGHYPERGAHSVCMHRPDARTMSFSWIHVDKQRVSLRYGPDAPCRGWPPGEPDVLERRAAPA